MNPTICPKCGPDARVCSDAHRQRDGRATIYTCCHCLTCWDASGVIVPMPPARPDCCHWPEELPVAQAD